MSKSSWKLVIFALALAGVTVMVRLPHHLAEHVNWAGSYQDALSTASTSNRRVLIAFTSQTCPACAQMEYVLDDAGVRQAMEPFVPVRIDIGRDRELANRLNIIGVPAYVVADGRGEFLASTVGYQPPEVFIRFLNRAASPPPSSTTDKGG